MQPVLMELILDRLAAGPGGGVDDLVLAAIEGDAELEAACNGEKWESAASAPAAAAGQAQGAFLRSLTVEGFRGVGPPVTLEFPPGPGLTLVAGRNGSGKSSFAEALEMLLTGSNSRWAKRSKVWAEDWRNLHHRSGVVIRAEFDEEGTRGATVVERRWSGDDNLEGGSSFAQRAGQPRQPPDALGWAGALESYRPFLPHTELGSMLDEGPSVLYDSLSRILGLDDLVDAADRLRRARLKREKSLKEAKSALDNLLPRLEDLDDERARRAITALKGRTWNLDGAQAAASGTRPGDDGGALAVLRQLADLAGPAPEQVQAAAGELRSAAGAVDALSQTDAGRAAGVARLLRAALDHHAAHGDQPCPVCRRGALDPAWSEQAARQAEQLEQEAREVRGAADRLDRARDAARRLADPAPAVLGRAAEVGLDATAATTAWSAFSTPPAPGDPRSTADHLEATAPGLAAAVADLSRVAADELARRDDAWLPIARELDGWVARARSALDDDAAAGRLKTAEQWVKGIQAEIRDERFAPIAEQCRDLWRTLRQQSNVELGRVALTGTATSRRVVLDVTVDGEAGAALGVMSQGELNALALSLFLPRATLPESPFRFVVIDDPVQAMDPARVDGLARVLDEVARGRQVIVLSHDDRLPEAVRRLQIPATVLEVTRREGSKIEIRPGSTPVQRNIDDAFALAMTADLPADMAARVVPGFCRLALEAACTEVVRRRRLGRGEPYADVDRLLGGLTKLAPYLAAALFDDPARAGEVPPTLRQRFGRSKLEVYERVNKGSHSGDGGDLVGLVRNTEHLARDLQALP